MAGSVSPIVQRELANLDKDADTRRAAMKTLKSYAKDLDSKGIPQFLAQVSETKGPNSLSGECTISLFEVLARVHGRNIVPQIENIMNTIIRTLSSSAGSFPLHQACSKVVPAIARYGIDPSTPDSEKTRIICSLCKPLSDSLMGSQESLASGAALCLKALIESTNWKFASNDLVNEVCLKVAAALEEKVTQTSSHLGLVMALAKHNVYIIEAYARSLIRSGLQILNVGISENNSQKRFSAIQTINFLMKCVDSISIFVEIDKVVDIMERCQDDHMPYVRGAAFEALQTAKYITSQKSPKLEISPSPITGFKFRRNDNAAEFASPDSCITYDNFTDSPISTGQSSSNSGYSRRANRRLWKNDLGGVDISLKDGLFLKACAGCDAPNSNGKPSNTDKEQMTIPSPQSSRSQLKIEDMKIFETPRKLVRFLQNPTGDNSSAATKQDMGINASPTSRQVKKIDLVDNGSVIDSTESVSSTNDLFEGSAQKLFEECEVKALGQKKIMKKPKYRKAVVSLVLGLLLVFSAIILLALRVENGEVFCDIVPT